MAEKKVKKERKKLVTTGPAVVVLLTSRSELGVVRAVCRTKGTTVLPHMVRDFGTEAKAREYVRKGMAPRGYLPTVDVIDRKARKLPAPKDLQPTLF